MSKSTLAQKGLTLTSRLLVSTGFVVALTQSLDEDRSAGKSLAERQQQAWTQEVFSGNLMASRGSSEDLLAFDQSGTSKHDALKALKSLHSPSNQPAPSNSSKSYIALASTTDGQGVGTGDVTGSIGVAETALMVNRSAKRDRRIGWTWEPYKVSHGRRSISMNWSGSVWSMSGLFENADHDALPKETFTPSDDLELVMADARKFLQEESIGQAPDYLFAQAPKPEPATKSVTVTNASAALAYAPDSAAGLDEPFNAILTEQRNGQISEDNRVTVLGAVEEMQQLNGSTPLESLEDSTKIAPIAALPKPRASIDGKQLAKVSQPLDVTPVVIDLQSKEKKQAAIVQDTQANEGLTLAKSKARRAELKLASLSGDTSDKEKKKSRFASWFSFGSSAKKAKIVTKGEHAWVTNKLPKSSFSKKQKTCLANAIYFESRSEPEKGQIAVAQVVINRVKNPAYPNTICGVVYQNKHKRNACQFSFACDRIPDRIRSKKAWDLAVKLSDQVVNGEVWLKDVGSSTHYHATYVKPRWAKTMKRRVKIGLHIFFKTYGGGWS